MPALAIPKSWCGFGIRSITVEVSFLFAAALGMAIVVRLVLLSQADSSAVLGEQYPLYTYAFLQDLLSVGLVLCGAFFIGLFLARHPRYRFGLWTLYLFLIGFGYLGNLKYYERYKENFAWSHLQEGSLSQELWESLWAEIDYALWLQLLGLSLVCCLWFFSGLKVSLSVSPHSSKAVFFPKQTLSRLFLFCLSVLSLFLMANSGIAQASTAIESKENNIETAQFLERKVKASNFLLQLSFQQDQTYQDRYAMLLGRDPYRFREFHFGFDSTSQEKHKAIPLIPLARNRKYNIVLYIFESTAHSYLQAKVNEMPVTPTWQRLSQNAVVFENHYVQNPLSINSLFSLLSSAYSMPADIWAAREYPQIAVKSLPQILKQSGYHTAFLHTGDLSYAGQNKFLKNRGFDLIQDIRRLRVPPYDKAFNWGIDDRALVNAARDFAESSTQPYFMVLTPVSPHHPYAVPEEKFKITNAQKTKDDTEALNDTKIPNLAGLIKSTSTELSESAKEASQGLEVRSSKTSSFDRYLNALHYADAVMQEIIQALEEVPGGENTLFFIVADHGEAFGQHKGNFNHPFYLYEENVHVPFIIYNRKLFTKPLAYKGVSRHIDILPTILDSVAIKPGSHHEGVSLLRGGSAQIASFHTSWRNHLAGLRDGQWKYIFNLRYGTEELYDLNKDRKERRNIAQQHLDITERYKKYLTELYAYQRKYFETVLNQPIKWWTEFDKSNF